MRNKGIKIFFFALACTYTLVAHAQYSYSKPELAIGTNQGVAMLTTVGFNPTVEQDFMLGYTGGISARYIMQKYFGVQAELNYTQRGWKETSTTGEVFKRRLDYLELPFIAHIYFGKEKVRFFINLGPKIRYLINENSTSASSGGGLQQSLEIENKFDYSIFGGVGLEFRTPKAGYYLIEVRYDYGLGDLFPNRKGDTFSSSNNQAITLGVTFFYNVLKNKKYRETIYQITD